jgi:hypothetical protein
MSGRPGAGSAIIIRDALPADLPGIRSIYAHHVLHGLASFEEVPPDAVEIERRYRDLVPRGLPYLVAETDGLVAAGSTVCSCSSVSDPATTARPTVDLGKKKGPCKHGPSSGRKRPRGVCSNALSGRQRSVLRRTI